MRINANVELDAGSKTFASGFLPELIAALRRSRKGDLVAVTSADPAIGPELEAWCRFTRNSLVDTGVEEGRTRWVLRYGEAPEPLSSATFSETSVIVTRTMSERIVRSDRGCGSIPISTATLLATIVACAPHPRRRGGRWDWSACAGLRPRQPSSASAKSLSPVASRSCCRTLARSFTPARRPRRPRCSPTACCLPESGSRCCARRTCAGSWSSWLIAGALGLRGRPTAGSRESGTRRSRRS